MKRSSQPMFSSDIARFVREYFLLQKQMAVGWLWRIHLILQNFVLKVFPKLGACGEWNPSLCCRISTRAADQFSPLGGRTFTAQIRSVFHTFCIFCSRSLQSPRSSYGPSPCTNPKIADHRVLSTHIFRQIAKPFMFIQGSFKTCFTRPVFSFIFLQYANIVAGLSLNLRY